MPPVQPAEILAAFGIAVAVVVFLIVLAVLGVAVLIEEVIIWGKKRLSPRLQQEDQ